MDTTTGAALQATPVKSSILKVNFTLTERFVLCFCRDCQTVVSSSFSAVLEYSCCVLWACMCHMCSLCSNAHIEKRLTFLDGQQESIRTPLLKQDEECMFWWPDEPVLVFYPVGHVVAVWWCELRLSFPLILLRSTWPHCDARATENCHWCTECSSVWPAANQSSSAQHPPPQGRQWWNEWRGEEREKEENVSMNGNMKERTLVMSKPKYWELDPHRPSFLGL